MRQGWYVYACFTSYSNKVAKYIHGLFLPIRYSFRHPNSLTVFPCRTEYSKGGLTWKDLCDTIYMIWLIWTCNCKIGITFWIKIFMIRFLKDRMSSVLQFCKTAVRIFFPCFINDWNKLDPQNSQVSKSVTFIFEFPKYAIKVH